MEAKTTRNAQGGGTIRKRSDGRWEARYTIGIDPGTGKQIQKSVYGQTQKEVRQRLSKATTELDEGAYFEPTRMTVGQWIDIWLTDYTDDKKYLTVKHYKAQCKAHIKASLGAIRLADLTAPVIQRFYNSLLRGEPPLSPKSVRNIHGILTKALSTAVKVGYLKANPAALVTLPRVPKTEIQPLTDPQVEAFLKITEEEEYGLLFKVILFTGMREGEAIGLTWDSVNFQTGVISINKQLQKRPKQDGGFVFAPLKNDKVRSIAPAPFVMALLRQRRNGRLANVSSPERRGKAGTAIGSGRRHRFLPMRSALTSIRRQFTITSKSWLCRLAHPKHGCMTFAIPSPSSPSKTGMTSKPFKAIWDTPPPLSRWMFTGMFPRK